MRKTYMTLCPRCNHIVTYKNWFEWITYVRFQNLKERKFLCKYCGKKSLIKIKRLKRRDN